MSEFYNIISIFVTGGLFLAAGLMILFMAVPDSPLLGNYRRARYAMAGAYLFFVAVEVAKFFSGGHNVPLLQAVTLTIAVSQALLFTFAMLALLETRFPGWRPILREGIPAVLLIIAVFIVYTFCPESCFGIAFYACWGVYAMLLIRYAMLFRRNYRRFRQRMDNWFSGNEADRLRWVAFSFCAALVIGIGALMTSVFMSTAVALGFAVVFDVFYVFFAIRFINYAHRFHVIEAAMEADVPEDDDRQQVLLPAVAGSIEERLNSWTDAKLYLSPSVKIEEVAQRIGTNYKYLSTYIRTRKEKTFNQWVNELRIEEAKHLLAEYPDMAVSEIAFKVGFVNRSHFSRTFLALAKSSPKAWRASSSAGRN